MIELLHAAQVVPAFFIQHFLEYNYAPHSAPWYTGAIWPNVVVISVTATLGWLWSKTRYWPLRPLKRLVAAHAHSSMLIEEMHHLAHTGEEHPRVQARRAAGNHPTPTAPGS